MKGLRTESPEVVPGLSEDHPVKGMFLLSRGKKYPVARNHHPELQRSQAHMGNTMKSNKSHLNSKEQLREGRDGRILLPLLFSSTTVVSLS